MARRPMVIVEGPPFLVGMVTHPGPRLGHVAVRARASFMHDSFREFQGTIVP
ncbi:MAG: hypothetical protein OXI83_01735 [Gemmatimonadota bacterium]|nr:hypothetical protein [Gemmatimonadota bacterium]